MSRGAELLGGCLRRDLPCLDTTLRVLQLFLVLQKVRFPAVPLLVCFPAQGVTHGQTGAAPVLVTLGLYPESLKKSNVAGPVFPAGISNCACLSFQFWRMKWTVVASTNLITALLVKIPKIGVYLGKESALLLTHSQSRGQCDRCEGTTLITSE